MASMLGLGLLTVSLMGPAAPSPDHASSLGEVPAATRPAVPAGLRQVIERDSRIFAHLISSPGRQDAGAASDAATKRNWIQRHPSCFGAAVGFVGGFLIGFLPGDDAVFDDFTAEFNGAVLGGLGAGAGAIFGRLAGRR